MLSNVLAFENVSFGYKKRDEQIPILKGLHFTIRDGEFVSIVGASGSGKTTIFRLIAGLEEPTQGEILLNGKLEENRLGSVGYMPQQDLLMPWRTIIENARLPLEVKKGTKYNKQDIQELIKEFGLSGCEDKYPHELSGGMRQRVSFLRATLSGSNMMLLDEPFSALDAMTKIFMQEWLLEQWEKQKQTILFITHDITEALFLSDRIFVLTESPITTLDEVKVPLSRPRTQRDLNKKEVLDLREALIERFRVQVSK